MRWSNSEIERLRSLINDGLTYSNISQLLGRSICSVRGMIKRLKTKNKRWWTDEETKIIVKYYPIETTREIVKRLTGRSEHAINSYANKLNLKKMQTRCVNEEGRVYDNLTVVKRVPSPEGKKVACWLCSCVCGRNIVVEGAWLRNKGIKSCGCLYPNKLSLVEIFMRHYQKNAKDRSIEWDLTFEDFVKITSQPCTYCGRPADYLYRSGFVGSGIDRIKATVGYTISNVVPCCKECNIAKGIRDSVDFVAWIKRVNEHMNNKI